MNDIDNKYLVFEVDEAYALALHHVVEIIEYRDVTKVPETPDYIAGIINLRGHVVPVIDVRRRFRKAYREGVRPRCIVIIRLDNNLLGLSVDNVVDLVDINPEELTAAPQIGGSHAHAFISAIGIRDGVMQLVVDTDRLVNYNDLYALEGEERPAGDGAKERAEQA